MEVAPDPSVREVHVLFKTHLDIGFTDLARSVVRRYMEEFIPGALQLARDTRQSPERFVWTTGSWLVHHFLAHAPACLHSQMEEAITEGDFHWHALPFTTHTELMDASLFRLGLAYRDRLDARFGRRTVGAKMTDVPGHTRAMVPHLARAGVRFLHIGVNPASTVPDVPPVFVWRSSKAEIVVAYDKTYGAVHVLPGGVAVAVNLTNDNLGPPTPAQVRRTYAALRRRFPEARLVGSDLTRVADAVWPLRRRFPVVTAEIGDTWIHGVGTDPAKVARFRALARLRQRWITDGRLTEGSDADLRLGEGLLLTAEHTWGMDIKTHLGDLRTYRPDELPEALTRPGFVQVAASWDEQRDYARQAEKTLGKAERAEFREETQRLRPQRPKTAGGQTVEPGELVTLGNLQGRLGPDGSLRFLVRQGDASPLLPKGARHALAAFAWQTFSRADYRRFYGQYNTKDVTWARRDFTKVGLPASAPAAWHKGRVRRAALHESGGALDVELAFDAEACANGAPQLVVLRYRAAGEAGLDLMLDWFDKRPNRQPEAAWLGFRPPLAAGDAWSVEKLGQRVDTGDVVSRGARGLHASVGPVRAGPFSVESLDAALVSVGGPRLLDFDNKLPKAARGVCFNLWNNAWCTNFPQWYAEDARFRFQLRWDRV